MQCPQRPAPARRVLHGTRGGGRLLSAFLSSSLQLNSKWRQHPFGMKCLSRAAVFSGPALTELHCGESFQVVSEVERNMQHGAYVDNIRASTSPDIFNMKYILVTECQLLSSGNLIQEGFLKNENELKCQLWIGGGCWGFGEEWLSSVRMDGLRENNSLPSARALRSENPWKFDDAIRFIALLLKGVGKITSHSFSPLNCTGSPSRIETPTCMSGPLSHSAHWYNHSLVQFSLRIGGRGPVCKSWRLWCYDASFL